MHLIPITDKAQIAANYKALTTQLHEKCETKIAQLGFHGGGTNKPVKLCWNAPLHFWTTKEYISPWSKEPYWFSSGINDPDIQHVPDIVCEFNSPVEGINRRLGAFFCTDENSEIWLCHSGGIGGSKRGVGKNGFLAWIQPKLGLIKIDWPGGNQSFAIPVCKINGARVSEQFSDFVHLVQEGKKSLVAELNNTEDDVNKNLLKSITTYFDVGEANYTDEYSGKISYKRPYGIVEYQRDHGLVVRELKKFLKRKSVKVTNTQEIDLIVRKGNSGKIYEIKTETKTQSLYTAIGQLFYHGIDQYANYERVLVLPKGVKQKYKFALRQLKIQLIEFTIVGLTVEFT